MEPETKKRKTCHSRASRRTRSRKSPSPEPVVVEQPSVPNLDPVIHSASVLTSLTDRAFYRSNYRASNLLQDKLQKAPDAPAAAAGSAPVAPPSDRSSVKINTSTYVPKYSSATNVMQLIQERYKLNFQDPVKLVVEDTQPEVPPSAQDESGTSTDISQGCPLLQLPVEIIHHIFDNYMTYEEVSKLRGVCKFFRNACSDHLNRAFSKLQTKMQARFQAIKAQMPRRESARRKHPLARECDIIETVHMRLTLLQMTFGRHIDRKHCCFFPGAIVDEVYRILDYIKITPNLGRAYKVTDELFDLSTMAMEYFKDKVEPTLPEVNYFTTEFPELASTFKSSLSCTPPTVRTSSEKSVPVSTPRLTLSATVPNKKKTPLQHQVKVLRLETLRLKRDLTRVRRRTVRVEKQNTDLNSRMTHFERKDDERERKMNVALEELRKCQTELTCIKQLMTSQVVPPVVEN